MTKIKINFSCDVCPYITEQANEGFCNYYKMFIDSIIQFDKCPFAYYREKEIKLQEK